MKVIDQGGTNHFLENSLTNILKKEEKNEKKSCF